MSGDDLKAAILHELAERPTDVIDLAWRLDEDPQVILRALKELESEERVVQLPPVPWYSLVE
jgi:predicted Rossmann fold nucleotide-binding protein DprA/Smf involved in DNA uptake